jgi:HAD superfamily hydrolase (TIGR01509 family)
MRPARAVILDFNGTLADDEALLIGIYEELLREHGLAFEAGEYPRYAGLPDQAMFARLFHDSGRPLEAATKDRLLRDRVGRYRSAVSDGHPVADETAAFVRALAAQVPVGIASGAFREEIEHVLELAGLAELVAVIVSIDEVRAGKPDPESFIAALEHINRDRHQAIEPEQTVVVEDSTDGARAARAAGMRCVALRGLAYDADSGFAELVVDRLTVELADTLLGPGP